MKEREKSFLSTRDIWINRREERRDDGRQNTKMRRCSHPLLIPLSLSLPLLRIFERNEMKDDGVWSKMDFFLLSISCQMGSAKRFWKFVYRRNKSKRKIHATIQMKENRGLSEHNLHEFKKIFNWEMKCPKC